MWYGNPSEWEVKEIAYCSVRVWKRKRDDGWLVECTLEVKWNIVTSVEREKDLEWGGWINK